MGGIVATTVAGIEFDALIEKQEDHSATAPQYPIDAGYSVTDNVALEPTSLKLTLYVTATPVTFLASHGSGFQRVQNICDQLLRVFESRSLIDVITPNKSYSNMVMRSISIRDSLQSGYAKEIPVEFQQVTVTSAKAVAIPAEYERAGGTMESAGTASTTTANGTTSTTAADRQNGNASGNSVSSSQNGSTLLYDMANGLGNATGWYSMTE